MTNPFFRIGRLSISLQRMSAEPYRTYFRNVGSGDRCWILRNFGILFVAVLKGALMFQYADGGLAETGLQEKLDCCVRAVAVAAEIPYYDAHAMMKAAGRRDRCRMKGFADLLNATPKIGRYYVVALNSYYTIPLMKIREFVALQKPGRYIVRVNGHVFAVIDGVVYDKFLGVPRSGKRILNVWKLEAL